MSSVAKKSPKQKVVSKADNKQQKVDVRKADNKQQKVDVRKADNKQQKVDKKEQRAPGSKKKKIVYKLHQRDIQPSLIGKGCKIISNENEYKCETREEFFDAWTKVEGRALVHHPDDEHLYKWNEKDRVLTKNVLSGNSTFLFHRHVNRIKSELFDKVYALFGKDGTEDFKPTLISIGAGRGGDIWKWNNKFSKVLIVEPSAEHIEELKSRLEANEKDGKLNFEYKIIQTNGQDVDTILAEAKDFFNGAIDVVSFMLSLTFFNLEDKEQLKNLVKLSRSGQVLMFMVADADRIKANLDYEPEVVSYSYSDKEEVISITEGVPESKVSELFKIDIPDSIVRQQSEFLFYPKKFLKAVGGKIYVEGYTDDEMALLGNDELWLSKLYYYAIVATDEK